MIPLGLEPQKDAVLPKMHASVPTISKHSHLTASTAQIRHFGCLQQKKSEMGSKIFMLLHGKLSVLARR